MLNEKLNFIEGIVDQVEKRNTKSRVLNSTVKPAGGPNGKPPDIEILDPLSDTALHRCCKMAALEIADYVEERELGSPVNRQGIASIIYRHMRNGREL